MVIPLVSMALGFQPKDPVAMKIFKILQIVELRRFYSAILPSIDFIIRTFGESWCIHETVDVTVFLDDSTIPSSISTSTLQ